MMAKGAIRDTARVLGYEYAVGDRISKIIPLGSQGFPMSIDKALNTTPELKQMYDTDADAKKLLTPLNKLKAVLDTSVSTPVLLLFLPLLSLIFLQFKP